MKSFSENISFDGGNEQNRWYFQSSDMIYSVSFSSKSFVPDENDIIKKQYIYI